MLTLIAYCDWELHSTLRNEVYRVSPMSTACSCTLHDLVIAADRLTGFIYKHCARLRRPEYF
jgi:hypothetical protein